MDNLDPKPSKDNQDPRWVKDIDRIWEDVVSRTFQCSHDERDRQGYLGLCHVCAREICDHHSLPLAPDLTSLISSEKTTEFAAQSWEEKTANGRMVKVSRILYCQMSDEYENSCPFSLDDFFEEKCRESDIVACCVPCGFYPETARENGAIIVDDCACLPESQREIDNKTVFASISEALKRNWE